MKTNTLLHALLCLLFVGLAMQPGRAEEPVEPHVYLPLFGEQETLYTFLMTGSGYSYTDSVYYVDNKIFNGKIYKVFKSYTGISFLIRTTEDNSKVYCYDGVLEREILTFDLDLTKENGADSIYTDEKGRKNIIVYNGMAKYIEGEGSSIGLFYGTYYWQKHNPFLLCSWKDGEHSYFFYEDLYDLYELCRTGYYNYCNNVPDYTFSSPACSGYGYTGMEDSRIGMDFQFYPNPARDRITVEAEDTFVPANTVVEIVDVAGRVCLQKSMEETPLELSLKGVQNGTYILRVVSNGRQFYSNTLLIE